MVRQKGWYRYDSVCHSNRDVWGRKKLGVKDVGGYGIFLY